ncbi:hypothetical protein ACCX84_10620 [Pantoea trifolii]
MESRGPQHPLSLNAFGQAMSQTLKEYERILLKHRTNNGSDKPHAAWGHRE